MKIIKEAKQFDLGALHITGLYTNALKNHMYKIRDNPKLLDDSGKIPKPNGLVGGSIPNREILSLLHGQLGGQAPSLFPRGN